MRIFILMLIFAIGFSGYAAAAHSVAGEICNPATMESVSDQTSEAGLPDCPGHAEASAKADAKDSADSSGSTKSICLDCHHCCTAHVASVASYVLDLPADAASLDLRPSNVHKEGRLFSLLRPPKSLV